MRYLNLVLIAILLAGCGAIHSIKIAARLPEKTSFAFRDLRPVEERHTRMAGSHYGKVLYYGDDRVSPTGPELLAASLESRLHAMLAGKTVALSEFNVYVHDAAASLEPDLLNAFAAATPGGYAGAPFAGLLIRGVDKGKSGKKIVRVRISGTVDRTEFSSDTADTYSSRVTEEDMQATLSKALDEATLQVQRVIQVSGSCSTDPSGCGLRTSSGG